MNIFRFRAFRVGLAILIIAAIISPFAQYFRDSQDCCEDSCCDDFCTTDFRDCHCHGLTVAGFPVFQGLTLNWAACGLVVRPSAENYSALFPDDTDHPPRMIG